MPIRDPGQSLAERAELAAAAPHDGIEPFLKETVPQVLMGLARNPHLCEQDLLRLLERRDLTGQVIKEIASHREATRSYAVKLAVAQHPKTPRPVSLPLLKFLYLFDLVRVCLRPGVPADVKIAAESNILKRVETLPRGEKITLARRAPGRVAAALLLTEDRELIHAALDNTFLSEADLVSALSSQNIPAAAVESIAQNEKWSRRYHLRLALVRNPLTPLARVLAFLPNLAVHDLRDACLDRRMPEHVRNYVRAHCVERLRNTPKDHEG